MKIRNGFVSNSSSSSFILLGVQTSFELMMNNLEFKSIFDKEMDNCQNFFNEKWNKIVNNPDYQKHKEIYEMCKKNGVSIPNETKNFFGYNFKGVFEPQKPNKNDIYREIIIENKFKLPKEITYIDDETRLLIGKRISSGGDELNNGSLSLNDINNLSEELVKLGFDKNDIKLYYGTYAC